MVKKTNLMIKKILIIALKYSYGNKNYGPSINKGALEDSFKNLGFSTRTIWIDEHEKKSLNQLIISEAEKFNPDLVFFKLFKDEIYSETLLKLKKGFKTVNWFGDDPWRFDSFAKYYANKFTFVITTNKYSTNLYNNIGQNKVIMSQHASFPSEVPYKKVNYKYDVSFVGTKSAYRDWFIKKLRKKGINCHCFGKGWENGLVSYEKMGNIFNTSKVNLNINNCVNYDLRVNFHNPKNLIEVLKALIIKNRKIHSHIKARNFEIPVNGGFQLTDYIPGIEDYFKIGKELMCYKDFEDALSLIKYLLKNEKEREIIKINSVIRARKQHTYSCRMKDIIENISCDK
tara:strand:+ start:1066 stop:2094 length:1029 start_codon:yes stop_codon:yes gene_type:complete